MKKQNAMHDLVEQCSKTAMKEFVRKEVNEHLRRHSCTVVQQWFTKNRARINQELSKEIQKHMPTIIEKLKRSVLARIRVDLR